MTREEALKELRLLFNVVVEDILGTIECVEQKNWKKLEQKVKRIKKRRAEYGI